VDALPYLGPRLPGLAVGDEMVDRSFLWSDSGCSVFGGSPCRAWVPGPLREPAGSFDASVMWAWRSGCWE
jgi:hypothetical protein